MKLIWPFLKVNNPLLYTVLFTVYSDGSKFVLLFQIAKESPMLNQTVEQLWLEIGIRMRF